MQIKKVVKKLVALGAGTTMLGATVMGAMAADLSSYPGSFQTDGVFNGYFVVGEAAQPIDNLAMTDIATSMWYSKSGSTTTVSGDAWLAETDGNFLELNENISSIQTYLSAEDLTALADGSISNAKGNANYEQFLYFDENSAVIGFQEDDNDNIGPFYKIPNAGVIARYVLDFTEALESDIDSNQDLDDIEDKAISVLGKTYTITTAENTSTGVKLVLMGGAVSDTLNEQETKTYTVGGTEYKVSLLSVSTDTVNKVQFSVNGETTNKLADSESDVLSDGTNIGVSEITYQNYAGGIHSATFFIGADKIELQNGSSLKVNEETINEATVLITSTESAGDVSIDDLSVNMTADDDFYMGIGEKLSGEAELEEPQVLLTQNWDLYFAGLSSVPDESVSLTFSEGDDQADLSLVLYDGQVSIPVVYQNSSSADEHYGGEDDNERLVLNVSNSITDEDLFFLSTADPDDATTDAKTYFLQYKGADDTGETNPKVRVKNVVTGETMERSFSGGVFDLKLGGITFNFANASATSSDDFNIKLTSGGSTGYSKSTDTGTVKLRTKGNNEVSIISANESLASEVWTVQLIIDDSDKFDDAGDAGLYALNVAIDTASGNDELTATTGGGHYTLLTHPQDDNLQIGGTAFGESSSVVSSDNSPNQYYLDIPKTQTQAMFYVTSGAVASATSAVGGELALVQVVDATRLDSEVSSISAQNLILVGGPCVNTLAAELLGNPADCTQGFSPGKARLKMFDNGANMAMLVAGYSGADTRLAGKVIAHRWKELNGEEVEVAGTTYSDATIGAPVVIGPTSE
ncbi:MAG: hypothetical protein ABIA37_02705 [Candidatus Woesearchaeota archaeon]